MGGISVIFVAHVVVTINEIDFINYLLNSTILIIPNNTRYVTKIIGIVVSIAKPIGAILKDKNIVIRSRSLPLFLPPIPLRILGFI